MTAKKIAQLIIGSKGFVVERIDQSTEMNKIIIAARPTKRESCHCGICRRKCKRYDGGRGRRRWRCLDLGPQKVYVEAAEPRVLCKEHGVVAAAVPWAQRCRIPVFRDLRKKIKRHFDAIVASARYALSNARMEATNNKIKLVIWTAYGFRNHDSMLAMVMLTCSPIRPALPGR